MIKVMSSALVSVCLLKHVVAPIRAATTNQASTSGLMRLVVASVNVIQPLAWWYAVRLPALPKRGAL